VTLLADVVAHLESEGVSHGLIGAAALAVHGVARSTQDDDLLVVDQRVLQPEFWRPLAGDVVRVLRGDHDDPLAGAVRLARRGERTVDVVVGRWAWQKEALARARRATLPDVEVTVVDPADLILLKLDAGGPQDRYDVEALLGLVGPVLAEQVEVRLAPLSASLKREWALVRSAPRGRGDEPA
jgi:hypothetical protein